MKLVSIVLVVVLLYANFIFSSERNRVRKSENIPFKLGVIERFSQRKLEDFAALSSEEFLMLKFVLEKDMKKIENLRDRKGKTVFHALLLHKNSYECDTFRIFCKCVESTCVKNIRSLPLYLPKTDTFTLLKKIEQDGIRKKYVEFLIKSKHISRKEAIEHKLVQKEKNVSFPKGWE